MNEHGAVIMMGKQKYSEKTLYQCYSSHHKFYMDWLGTESGLLWYEAFSINLSYGLALVVYWIFLPIQIYHTLQNTKKLMAYDMYVIIHITRL